MLDGGVSSNYPLWLFDAVGGKPPRYPTFGFLLDESIGEPQIPPKPLGDFSPVKFASKIVFAGMGAIDRIHNDHDKARTIRLPTNGVGTTDFDITDRQKQDLFDTGYRAAEKFLEDFNWHAYVRDYQDGRARIPPECAIGAVTSSPKTIDGVEYVAHG